MPEWLITTVITLVANAAVWLIAIGKFLERVKNNEKRTLTLETKFENRTMLPECLKILTSYQVSEANLAGEIKTALARLETKVEFLINGGRKP